ncbi:hypothetical protein B0O99DRAFT_315661 [Bisporella sp. PMI_857]|nr:hypothetical protein B0O99DRAFT_315661 [Bisporella sp. PMI_857]
MILNTTEQWDLFYAHACSNFQPAVYRRPERYRERLAVIIEDIEQSCSKLQALPARFREIREKAKTLRDGHLNLITIESARANLKEAKQGSKMGSRIALLTYVTVFYLPLALCTSMWSINDIFGTGVLGFCIVTSAVSLLTYSITILLLNLDVKKYVKARRGARGDKGLIAVPLSPELSPRSPEGSGDLEQQMTASTAFKTPASITERESTIKRRLLSSLFGRKKAGINDQEKGGIL